jgi:hypothetical protein
LVIVSGEIARCSLSLNCEPSNNVARDKQLPAAPSFINEKKAPVDRGPELVAPSAHRGACRTPGGNVCAIGALLLNIVIRPAGPNNNVPSESAKADLLM